MYGPIQGCAVPAIVPRWCSGDEHPATMQDPASTTATIDSKDFTACRRYEVRSRFRVQQPLRVVVNDHSDRSVTALLDHLKSAVGSDANEVAVGHVVRKERDAAELEGLVVAARYLALCTSRRTVLALGMASYWVRLRCGLCFVK